MERNQRQARAIGTYDQPNIHGSRLGITAVENNNFEIKSSLINMIENNKYHGLALEDPLDHLDQFDKYCGFSKTNGVSEDAFKLRLFPFSLGEKAHTWEKNFLSDYITTWNECKTTFLNKFFSSSRTAKLRNEISGFQQRNLEGFSEAWERFRSCWSQCLHHGFTKESLLSTFYRGVLPKFRSQLDTGSNGFFLGRTEEDAEKLVENMAHSDSVYNDEHDRSNRGSGGDDQNTRKELKALQDKLDNLLSDRAKQEKVNSIGEQKQEGIDVVNEVDGLEGQEELCFVNANETWYKKEPKFQYHNNYQQKLFYNNQQGGCQSTQGQVGSSTSSPQESSINTMLKQILESQNNTAKSIGDELKILHTKIDGNYNDLNNNLPLCLQPPSVQWDLYQGNQSRIPKIIAMRVTAQAELKVAAEILKRDEHKAEKQVEREAVQKLKEVKLEGTTEVEHSPYDNLPFPQRVLTKAQKKVISKFRNDMSAVGIKLPEISHMRDAHVQMMLIKDILAHKEEVAELLDISTFQLDPPSLGIENMEPNISLLMFGDSSSTTPIGLIKDFALKIGACTMSIDLTVLKMATEKIVLLILSTPFLTTVGACIDFANEKVTLLNVNKAISYPIKSPMMNVEYCGTITYGEPSIEKLKGEVIEGVSRAIEATHDKKKMMKEPHPTSVEKYSHILTLHQIKFKDGVIEYKIKCKGRSKLFSGARAIITPQLQDDPLKLQELLSQVLTITLEGGKDPPSPFST
ncbi:PREDICTED: uncharacterized protein LOC106330511 [Brassica oleracea var. oleracea]|uniref:uncharacterized protein LOC106330511 n=1 Tax=Brassica oleracea var. oleracea TaxID=109376 RepID=UPI0006A6B173|nr:PREDICTED: uncharacterized protein LOC106330511 [Brassica oleracea var. oleracea]